MPRNFAVTGVAGHIAPRHLRAIKETGNALIAAVDPSDSVGVLDAFSFDVAFFNEIERFDRFLDKTRRGPEASRVHYLTVCSPNHLHDAHCRMGLRAGADVVCEKPLVVNPWNLDALQVIEGETGRRVHTVLQLRLHPRVITLRQELAPAGRRHDVELTCVAPRGRWYEHSWKGSPEKSGGVPTNIGVHFFDLLTWLFGACRAHEVHGVDAKRMAGYLELARADVRFFLSVDPLDLPEPPAPGRARPHRLVRVDGREVPLSDGFDDLHTRVYEEVLAGRAPGIEEARPAIELAYRLRTAAVTAPGDRGHPLLRRS